MFCSFTNKTFSSIFMVIGGNYMCINWICCNGFFFFFLQKNVENYESTFNFSNISS